MTIQNDILNTLHQEVKIAIGCTEPVAIALAVAHAAAQLEPQGIQKIKLGLSPNMYKNTLNVGIPGTDFMGLEIAAALGAFCSPEKGLMLLKSVGLAEQHHAQQLVETQCVEVYLLNVDDRIYIKAEVHDQRSICLAEIKGKHDGLTFLQVNDQILVNEESVASIVIKQSIYEAPFKSLLEGVESLVYGDLAFLEQGLEVNLQAAARGLKDGSGLGIGQKMQNAIQNGYLGNDLANETLMMAAAASDARMSGEDIEIMTSNGSGNNGITALIPLAIYAKNYNVSKEKLVKAIALSHLVNGKIKHAIGRLSPMCACGVAAATGASVGLVYMMGGTFAEMENSVQAMLSNLSGMICDGAKIGCSLKLATSASTAVQTAIFAKGGLILTKGNGILGESADVTIAHLGRVALEGMSNMDQTILSIMSGE
jgi:L-cysteine desulfidase